jgi:hypothetical protein
MMPSLTMLERCDFVQQEQHPKKTGLKVQLKLTFCHSSPNSGRKRDMHVVVQAPEVSVH